MICEKWKIRVHVFILGISGFWCIASFHLNWFMGCCVCMLARCSLSFIFKILTSSYTCWFIRQSCSSWNLGFCWIGYNCLKLGIIVHQYHAVFLSCICTLCLCVSNAVLNIGFLLCFHSHLYNLVMAPKKSKTIKTKAKRVSASSSKPAKRVSASSSKPAKRVSASSSKPPIVFDETTFQTVTQAQRFENVIQYWTIWPEREINLDELPLAVHRNLQCRNWLSLCKGLQPPPVALIREFYANLEIRSDNDFATWIRGRYFVITKNDISTALDVPRVRTPTYPYSYSNRPEISDVMTLLCGRSMTLAFTTSRINSSDLTELNYILFRIACHNIFPISHVHTIPRERCYFLYALVTDASICFASLFYETLVRAHRSKSKKPGLFFPVFIYRVLNFLGLENFPSLELIHIIAPIGATFLK